LSGGFSSRVLNNFISIGPALQARAVLDQQNLSQPAKIFGTALIETMLGTFLEVNSSRPALAKIGNQIEFKDVPKMYNRVFTPFLVRNLTVWSLASKNPNITLEQKMALGALIGGASIVPHNIGNELMRRPISESMTESFGNVCTQYRAAPTYILKGWSLRSMAGVLGTLMLSGETSDFLQSNLKELSTMFFEASKSLALTTTSETEQEFSYKTTETDNKVDLKNFEQLPPEKQAVILESLGIIAQGLSEREVEKTQYPKTELREFTASQLKPEPKTKSK
jgi:hypothetical protein